MTDDHGKPGRALLGRRQVLAGAAALGAAAAGSAAKALTLGGGLAGDVGVASPLLHRVAGSEAGTLVFGVTQEAVNFNPLLYVNTGVETSVEFAVFDSLWKIDEAGKFVPNLAVEDGLAFESAVITGLGGRSASVDGPEREAFLRRRRAIARLARLVSGGGSVVINADEPEADPLGAVNLSTRRVTYGLERAAQVSAALDHLDPSGSRFRLRGFDREATISLQLAGEEHVGHALAASAVAWSLGIPLRSVIDGLESVTRIPGRLEPVLGGQDFEVRVDQARSAPELARALATLRGLVAGRLICVIGAEGGVQRLRRAALARAAEAGAERVILTTTNPRGDDPDQILDDLLAGLRNPGRAFVEPDRRGAIARALADARPGDAVLIAGKGHHNYQILDDRVFPFDDAEVAATWLRANRPASRRTSA